MSSRLIDPCSGTEESHAAIAYGNQFRCTYDGDGGLLDLFSLLCENRDGGNAWETITTRSRFTMHKRC
jgi:hypothetical protein